MRASTESTQAKRIPVSGVLRPRSAAKPRRSRTAPLRDTAEDHFRATPDELFARGLCYSTGQGVPQDLVKAHTFFNLAALAGNGRAREMRTEIAQDMTPAEIAAAQRLARELRGKSH